MTRELTPSQRRRAGLDLDNGGIFLLVAGAIALALVMFPVSTPAGSMRTSPIGRSEIIRHEAIRYVPYKDRGGKWTGGIGHLIIPGDGWPRDSAGNPLPIDETFLMTLFETDLGHAENAIRRNVRVPLTQGQFDALADFVFQFGAGKFASSDLLAFLNRGDYAAAAAELKRWVYVADENTGQMVQSAHLVERRGNNYAMFLA
jgi:lysozyme